MADILSQDEIDALLSTVSDEPAGEGSGGDSGDDFDDFAPDFVPKKYLYMILDGQTGFQKSSFVLLETCMISLQETSAQIYQVFKDNNRYFSCGC